MRILPFDDVCREFLQLTRQHAPSKFCCTGFETRVLKFFSVVEEPWRESAASTKACVRKQTEFMRRRSTKSEPQSGFQKRRVWWIITRNRPTHHQKISGTPPTYVSSTFSGFCLCVCPGSHCASPFKLFIRTTAI